MLIKNLDDMLVNGSMGRILRFADPTKYGTEGDQEVSVGPHLFLVSTLMLTARARSRPPTQGMTRLILVVPELWKVELPNGEIQVSRTQVRSTRLSALFER